MEIQEVKEQEITSNNVQTISSDEETNETNVKEKKREEVKYKARSFKWENTNMMLSKVGYTGLKTGITEAAGPCCSVTYQKDGNTFVFVLLNSNSMESRWEEVPILLNYAISKPQSQMMINGSKENLNPFPNKFNKC